MISGVVFWDNNYNGVFDEGDKAISEVLLTCTDTTKRPVSGST